MEEHSVRGGLGGAVTEVLAKDCPVPVSILGAEDYAESGDLNLLMKKYGFGADNIARRAKEVIAKK